MAAFFRERGVRTFDSEANCLWQHTGMDIDDYRRMFEAEGILLSRPFEPMRDWCRVSLADDAGNTRFMEVWDRLFG
jgi:histidinol-phosphate aminotransferase